ncbi:MAG: hypothetical protein AAF942_05850 [Pseudomonadota bacterium]
MTFDLSLPRDTPIIVEDGGTPGAQRWIASMHRFGTNVAGLVKRPAPDADAHPYPVFTNFFDAVSATKAEICVTTAPPRTAADAVLEAAEAGVRLIVSLSLGMPVNDSMRVVRRVRDLGIDWLGAGSNGLAIPSEGVKLGAIPNSCLAQGDVAVISASGGLAAEAGFQFKKAGLGQSLVIDVGEDPVKGLRMSDFAEAINSNAATRAIVLLGTTVGTEEEEFADALMGLPDRKPVFAYIAGHRLPPRDMTAQSGLPAPPPVQEKAYALAAAGVNVYNSIGALVAAVRATS